MVEDENWFVLENVASIVVFAVHADLEMRFLIDADENVTNESEAVVKANA